LSTNIFDIIADKHRGIKHFGICFPILILYCLTNIGIEKIFQYIVVNYYSITQANVAWVVKRYNICNLRAVSKNTGLVIPIISKQCLNCIQFDLIDFTTIPDSIYYWILQIKDTFSCYIWLILLTDKEAATIAAVLEIWIGQNRYTRQ
jgi:hypothetical protein